MMHGMKTRHFAQRLNKCLDELGMPLDARDRSAFLGKMLHIPRQQARMMLEGFNIPDEQLVNQIAQEFEVDTMWLLAKK